jgi:hypothetical protein
VAVFNQEQEVGTVTRQVHNPESSPYGNQGCSIGANGISYRNVADAERCLTRAAGGNPIVLSENTPRLAPRTVSEASA